MTAARSVLQSARNVLSRARYARISALGIPFIDTDFQIVLKYIGPFREQCPVRHEDHDLPAGTGDTYPAHHPGGHGCPADLKTKKPFFSQVVPFRLHPVTRGRFWRTRTIPCEVPVKGSSDLGDGTVTVQVIKNLKKRFLKYFLCSLDSPHHRVEHVVAARQVDRGDRGVDLR